MPRKKSDLNNACSRQARRKRVARGRKLAEQKFWAAEKFAQQIRDQKYGFHMNAMLEDNEILNATENDEIIKSEYIITESVSPVTNQENETSRLTPIEDLKTETTIESNSQRYDKVLSSFTMECKNYQDKFLNHMKKQDDKYLEFMTRHQEKEEEMFKRHREESGKIIERDRLETHKMLSSHITNFMPNNAMMPVMQQNVLQNYTMPVTSTISTIPMLQTSISLNNETQIQNDSNHIIQIKTENEY